MTVADVKVSKQQSSQSEQHERGLARRGEWFPSLWSLHPRDFFSLSPFDLMRRFSDDMDRFFGRFSREMGEPSAWAPSIEVREKDKYLVVSAELPGLSKDDVKVEVTDEGLVIQGERKREHEERRQGYYRSERNYGRFYRLIPLPEDAHVDQARAQFNNGILEVTVPIPESQRKRREIPIEAEAKAKTLAGGA
jgi:HSP20 family protein